MLVFWRVTIKTSFEAHPASQKTSDSSPFFSTPKGLVAWFSISQGVLELMKFPPKRLRFTFCIHLGVVVSMCYFLGRNGVHHNRRKSHEKNGETAGFSNFWGLFQVIMANPVQKVSPDWSSKSRHFVGTGPILEDGIMLCLFRSDEKIP